MSNIAYGVTTKPITVKLGLISPTYHQDGTLNPLGSQTMAAFLLAVDEINTGNYLPNVRINVAVTFQNDDAYGGIKGAQDLLNANFTMDSNGQRVPISSFIGSNPIGVDFVIGTGGNDETERAGLVFQNFKIVQLHTVAMDTRLIKNNTI